MSTTTTQKNIPHWQQIVQDKHLDVSVVDSNLLDKELRFESEYFRPSFLDVEEKLKAKNSKSYKQYIKEVRCGPFGSTILHNTYKDSGVLVTRPFNIRNGTIEGENHAFISEEDCLRKNLKFYDKNDIFFARVGAVSCGLVPQFDYKITISPNIIAVRTDGNKLSPEYSSIFFNTIYGESQLLRAQKVVAQPTISTGLIQNILVSIPSKPFQERIAKLVQEAHRERETSKKLYQEAEDLLLSELGMKDWQPTEKNTAIKDSEEVQLYGRADAEFFQPKYDELFEKLEKTASKKLGKIVIYLKGIEPGSNAYAEDGVPFVRVSDVSIHGIENVEKKISAELFEKYKNSYSPKKGEVLFTKDGTIGISFVVDEDLDVVLSGAFLRLIPQGDIEPEYLALVLNSVVCKLQIERVAGGAIIAHLKPSDAMNLQIPILDLRIQKQIVEKIKTSHMARENSKTLLENAKKAVEIFVEKDEKAAEKFLQE